MRVKTEPEVFVISCNGIRLAELDHFLTANDLDQPLDSQLQGTPGEQIVEAATRTCYLSFGKGRPTHEFFANILEQKHGSTLEHATLTLAISGISRSLSHELVRHRHISISQLSQRYVDHSDIAIVMPPAIQMLSTLDKEYWKGSVGEQIMAYEHFADLLHANTSNRKQNREAARSLLPNCVETMLFATANARTWRWFCQLRSSSHADAEIQQLAEKIFTIIKAEWPDITQDMELGEEGVSGEHV